MSNLMQAKERPILFSGPMVRAILSGRTTQTRRIVKPQPTSDGYWWSHKGYSANGENIFRQGMPLFGECPYGRIGERLWVRESGYRPPAVTGFMLREGADTWPKYIYSADDDEREWCREHGWKSTPSIHMRRWASRITLEITGVRVERLQDISEGDAIAEGIKRYSNGTHGLDDPSACMGRTAVGAYVRLWNHINGAQSWAANSFVWVLQFKRVTL